MAAESSSNSPSPSAIARSETPARGPLNLAVSTSNDEIKAGSNFSIFVTATNPYDVPVTLYHVLTHVPVELLDINSYRIIENKKAALQQPRTALISRLSDWVKGPLQRRVDLLQAQTGTAIALGTELSPEETRSMLSSHVTIDRVHVESDGQASIAGIALNFPQNPSTEELDAIIRRLANYDRGIVPVTLQPGDSVVRQFVLRTKSRLLFTPIAHIFEIQATYAVDSLDHTVNIPYRLSIRAAMSSIVAGAVLGALLGGLVHALSGTGANVTLRSVTRGVAVAILASIAVVAAFARRSSAQPLVSVEDFWGGIVIGFSVGYFGFSQFAKLFSTK